MRVRWMIAVTLAVAVGAGAVLAQGEAFQVNGDPTLAFFDANGNCVPDDGDCFVTATGLPIGQQFAEVVMSLTQNAAANGTVPLQICQPCMTDDDDSALLPSLPATYTGSAFGLPFDSTTLGVVNFTSTCVQGLGTPHFAGVFSNMVLDARADASVAAMASQALTNGLPQPPIAAAGLPLVLRWGLVVAGRDGGPGFTVGAGALCGIDGTAGVRAWGRGLIGPTFLVDLERIDGATSDYLCTEVPMPRADTGAMAMIKSCIPVPVDGSRSVLTLGTLPIAELRLDELPPCIAGAPTATEWGLAGLAVLLLAVGTWGLSRRPAFARALRGA